MKNYHKTGGMKGKPAYRTPSVFRYKKHIEVTKLKTERKDTKKR